MLTFKQFTKEIYQGVGLSLLEAKEGKNLHLE